MYAYTMTNKIPAGAAGSYTVSIEARNTVMLLPGTQKETTATDAAKPVEFYFSVDKSTVAAAPGGIHREVRGMPYGPGLHSRRHAKRHPGMRHLPQSISGGRHLEQSVNFAWQIHSIHRGESLAKPYVLGTHQLPGSPLPGRSARLQHLPREAPTS